MELRDLRAFAVLAEELSFKDAAARLGMSQSTLSDQISRLEREIGTALFERKQRRAPALTPLGRVLEAEARPLLEHAERVQALVTRDRATAVPLKISAVSSVFAGLLPRVVPRLREKLPDLAVSIVQRPEATAPRALVDGRLDVAVGRSYRGPDGLAFEHLAHERLWVAVPLDHRVAGETAVELADLADEDFVIFRRDEGPDAFDSITSACHRAGFAPRIRGYVRDDLELLSSVACGLGLSFVPTLSTRHTFAGTTYVQVADEHATVPLSMAWRADDSSQALAVFQSLVRSELHEMSASAIVR